MALLHVQKEEPTYFPFTGMSIAPPPQPHLEIHGLNFNPSFLCQAGHCAFVLQHYSRLIYLCDGEMLETWQELGHGIHKGATAFWKQTILTSVYVESWWEVGRPYHSSKRTCEKNRVISFTRKTTLWSNFLPKITQPIRDSANVRHIHDLNPNSSWYDTLILMNYELGHSQTSKEIT